MHSLFAQDKKSTHNKIMSFQQKTLLYLFILLPLVLFGAFKSMAAQRAYIIDEDVPVYADPEMTQILGIVKQGSELLVGVPSSKNPKALPSVSEGKIVYIREGDTSFAVPETQLEQMKEVRQYRAPGSVGKVPQEKYYTTMGLTLGLVSFFGSNYVDALASLYPDTGLTKRRDHFPYPKVFAEGHYKNSSFGWQVALSYHYNNQDVIVFRSTMLDAVLYYTPFYFLIKNHVVIFDAALGFSILPYFEINNELDTRRRQTGFVGAMLGLQLRLPLPDFEVQAGLQFARYYSNGVSIINSVSSPAYPIPSSIELKKLSSYNLYLGLALKL